MNCRMFDFIGYEVLTRRLAILMGLGIYLGNWFKVYFKFVFAHHASGFPLSSTPRTTCCSSKLLWTRRIWFPKVIFSVKFFLTASTHSVAALNIPFYVLLTLVPITSPYFILGFLLACAYTYIVSYRLECEDDANLETVECIWECIA